MIDPVVRRADLRDVESIQRLFDQGDAYHAAMLPHVFREGSKGRPDILIASVIQDGDSDYLIATVESRVVGFLDIRESVTPDFPMFVPKRFALVENMVVDEGHRGKGIGTRLLEEARDWAHSRGLSSIQLTVWARNTEAVRLYRRLGFQVVIQRMERAL